MSWLSKKLQTYRDNQEAAIRQSTLNDEFYKAVQHGDLQSSVALLRRGASPNAMFGHRDGETVLMVAAAYGDIGKVRFLIEHGADVNYRGYGDQTALMLASSNGQMEAIEYLLSHGAEVNATEHRGFSALDYAEDCQDQVKRNAVILYLRSQGATKLRQ